MVVPATSLSTNFPDCAQSLPEMLMTSRFGEVSGEVMTKRKMGTMCSGDDIELFA